LASHNALSELIAAIVKQDLRELDAARLPLSCRDCCCAKKRPLVRSQVIRLTWQTLIRRPCAVLRRALLAPQLDIPD